MDLDLVLNGLRTGNAAVKQLTKELLSQCDIITKDCNRSLQGLCIDNQIDFESEQGQKLRRQFEIYVRTVIANCVFAEEDYEEGLVDVFSVLFCHYVSVGDALQAGSDDLSLKNVFTRETSAVIRISVAVLNKLCQEQGRFRSSFYEKQFRDFIHHLQREDAHLMKYFAKNQSADTLLYKYTISYCLHFIRGEELQERFLALWVHSSSREMLRCTEVIISISMRLVFGPVSRQPSAFDDIVHSLKRPARLYEDVYEAANSCVEVALNEHENERVILGLMGATLRKQRQQTGGKIIAFASAFTAAVLIVSVIVREV